MRYEWLLFAAGAGGLLFLSLSCGTRERCTGDECAAPHGARGACGDGYVAVAGGCVDDPCAKNPCVHGSCTANGAAAACACEAGYTGPRCDRCAEGATRQGDACVTLLSCADDPCLYGTCRDDGGTARCECWPGYAGGLCDQCAPGFEADNLACVPVATACEPNPCTTAVRPICELTGEGHRCLCAPGTHDDEGVCIPDGAEPCVGTACDQPWDGACPVTVRYVPGANERVTQLYVRGAHNGWDLSSPLARQSDGSYSTTLRLAPGSYAYKLFESGANRWFEDPRNPYFQWVDGTRNSRLRVQDCALPTLQLVGTPTLGADSVALDVRYLPGATRSALDPAALEVTRDDRVITATWVAASQTIQLRETGLPPGKHTYRVRVKDQGGRAAPLGYFPVWLEERAFRWEDALLYFVLTDRFANGDTANDAPVPDVEPQANWQGGDFAGLRAKLDAGYFDNLGVNALWLSSVTQNTQGAGAGAANENRSYSAYHSYWPITTGWREGRTFAGLEPIEPHFGTLDELKSLVRAAHARGLRVIVDFVANHVHTDAPLYQQYASPSAGWFNPLYVCGWEKPLTCWFASYLPDFDYKNTTVLEEVVEHAVWLAQETEIDGFRLDAVKHMDHDFSFALRARIQEALGATGLRFYMVGETFTGEGAGAASLIREYVRPEELDGQFDFPLYWQILTTLLREERTLASIDQHLTELAGYYGRFAVMSNFLGNHDVPRAASHASGVIGDMWGNGSKEQGWSNPPGAPSAEAHARLRLAWSFLLTQPGVPLIYYGDELGMAGAGDPDNRRMMRFDTALSADERATLAHVQKLGALRRAHPATRTGARTKLALNGDGLFWAYALREGNDTVIVALNRKGAAQTKTFSLAPAGLATSTLTDALRGGSVSVQGGNVTLTLGAREAAVLVLP